MDLVLNTRTGYVLPQYHVVFDEKFYTVEHMQDGTVPENWKKPGRVSIRACCKRVVSLKILKNSPTQGGLAQRTLEPGL